MQLEKISIVMNFKTVVCKQSDITVSQFCKAINIWRRNPQTVNRRILASIELLDTELECDIIDIAKCIVALDVSLLTEEDINGGKLFDALHVQNLISTTSNKKINLYIKKQLPRTPHVFSTGIEFVLTNSEGCCIVVHKALSLEKRSLGPRVAFMLKQEVCGYISVNVQEFNDLEQDPSIKWLQEKLVPCILKWAKNELKATSVSSLNLVSAEKYAKLYCELKEKYGKNLIENWPENTDPMKFVYEDIAIAAYLLLLWKKERLEKRTDDLQSFIDLGCGNGLLVYILFNEGHRGLGIDLRKRKIWDLYPPETPLQVSTVVPSSSTIYPNVDWIIGNHSDELTPWIPVIAARSSSNCRFFLLPCCSYELNGAKYQRYCTTKSQYSDYIDYVRNICDQCGFTTHLDKLRIPSTKRICLIGWERRLEETKKLEDRIQQMLNLKTNLTQSKEESNEPISDTTRAKEWTCDFKPRDIVEKVRNCTQLDKTLITDIINIVSSRLLHEGRLIFLEETNKTWNAGRCIELYELAGSIPREIITRLRKECGGLQTLLRNNSHIFCVREGKVEFRMPGAEKPERKQKKSKLSVPRVKTKSCWFYENHPNGCPISDAKCNFIH